MINFNRTFTDDTLILQCWDAKGFCEDIVEGKYTLPTVHAINTGTPEGNIVAGILSMIYY